jgi:hypothetical protein
LAGGIIAFVYQDSLTAGFKETMVEFMEEYIVLGDGEQAATDAWDRLQRDVRNLQNFTSKTRLEKL